MAIQSFVCETSGSAGNGTIIQRAVLLGFGYLAQIPATGGTKWTACQGVKRNGSKQIASVTTKRAGGSIRRAYRALSRLTSLPSHPTQAPTAAQGPAALATICVHISYRAVGQTQTATTNASAKFCSRDPSMRRPGCGTLPARALWHRKIRPALGGAFNCCSEGHGRRH